MHKDFDLYTLKFINSGDIIEEIGDGYSGAFLYKITRKNDKYFLKIFKGHMTEEKINKIKNICLIYKNLNIKSLEIIEFGNIDNFDNYYIVYNFIDGVNLKAYTNKEECSLNFIRQIGENIGKELLKLKSFENYDSNLFVQEDIDKMIEDTINKFYLLLEKDIYKDIILRYFNLEEITELKSKLIQYSHILKETEPHLIHGDIKRANVMMKENEEFYIIDIESMQFNYDLLNFKYQMTWCLFEGNEKEAEFVKGYFDGIYNGDRPINFNYGVIFVVILNFFTESYHRYKNSNIEGLANYMKKCKNLFNKISDLNLDKDFIV